MTVLAKKYMMEEGKMMCGYSKSKGSAYYFWRLVCSNPFNSKADMEKVIELIAKYCDLSYKELTKN